MFIIKHLTKVLGFCFAIYILHYNYVLGDRNVLLYGYQAKNQRLPDFAQFKNLQIRKQMFFHYLMPYIHSENKILLQAHNNILRLHQLFLQHHKLTLAQLYWLNDYHQDSTQFEPYNKTTWQKLLEQTDTIPSNLLLYYAQYYYKQSNFRYIIKKYNSNT